MFTKLLLSTLITLLCSIPFLQAQTYTIYNEWVGFNPNNNEEIYNQISTAFEEVYTEESEAYHIARMRWIKHKLDNLLLTAPYSEVPGEAGCSSGEFSKSSGPSTAEETEVFFSWESQVQEVEEYFAYELDLNSFIPSPSDQFDSVTKDELEGNLPVLSLTVSTEGLHLFAINTRCSSFQSDYTIIIVEKVINQSEGIYVPCVLFPEDPPQGRLSGSQLNISMDIVPNLVKDTEVQINLELNEIQYISMKLFDANTGRLVKTILRRQEVNKGNRNRILNVNDLSAGMYFIVLQTDTQRIVKRLVKI